MEACVEFIKHTSEMEACVEVILPTSEKFKMPSYIWITTLGAQSIIQWR